MNAIYARQSLDKKDSLSIEGQIALCRRAAGEEAAVYQDRGFSGKNIKRPAFAELIQAIEAGEIEKIFVYRLDRFSRSIADFSRLWELLERHGVAFHSVTEQFDTSSPIGRAMLNIVLVFAQLERETTAERVRDNYLHRFRLGAWPGGVAPYGYDLTKLDDGGRKVSSLIANDRAETVRRIFEDYALPDTSLRGIARALTEQGIHGPRREVWDNVTLSRILRSPLYVRADESVYWYYLTKGMRMEQEAEAFDGVHACNIIGRRGQGKDKRGAGQARMLTVSNHEGIIPSGLWLRVQDKLERNMQISREKAGKYSWLTGLLKCARCGYAVKINYIRAEDRRFLVCSGRSNLSNCDASIQIHLGDLEARVAAEIQALLDSVPPEADPVNTGEHAAEILAVEQKIDRLVKALAESSQVSAAYISRQIETLHQEREALLASVPHRPDTPRRLDFDAASFAEKKLIAAELIDRITLDGDRVNIHWKL